MQADVATTVKDTPQTIVTMDPDVQRVLEFMGRGMEANKLVSVAAAVAKLSPMLWGRYDQVVVTPLTLSWTVTKAGA